MPKNISRLFLSLSLSFHVLLYFLLDGKSSSCNKYEATGTLSVNKSADKDVVREGEVVKYTIVVNNPSEGIWKNVVVTDDIPVEYVRDGVTTIDGKYSPFIGGSMNHLSTNLGDIKPGESHTIVYYVRLRDGVQGPKAKILKNSVVARGDNGTATDSCEVKVPPKKKGDGDNLPNKNEPYIEKKADKSSVDLSTKDRRVTYTVTLHNPTNKVWKNIHLEDQVRTNFAHLYVDSVRINGRSVKFGGSTIGNEGYEYRAGGNNFLGDVRFPVGDIQPGKSVKVEYALRLESDIREEYQNIASAVSDNFDPKEDRCVVRVYNNQPVSGVHIALTMGRKGSGKMDYDDWILINEAAAIIFRGMTPERYGRLQSRTPSVTSDVPIEDQFYVAEGHRKMWHLGVVREKDYDSKYVVPVGGGPSKNVAANGDLINRMLRECAFKPMPGIQDGAKVKRGPFVDEFLKQLGRDKPHDVNGCEVRSYTDEGKITGHARDVTDEASVTHDYVLDNMEKEIWVWSDVNDDPKIW